MPKDKTEQAIAKLPLKAGQIFQHFKGGRYKVVTLAVKEDTLEMLVIYKSVINNQTWARTYLKWSEEVDVDGKKFKRFELIN